MRRLWNRIDNSPAEMPIVVLVLCFFGLLLLMPFLQGCAGCRNDIAARGGLIGSYAGDYVVISQSGGLIMDCWKLEDVYVESVSSSDGWRFKDVAGNVIFIGGDVKIIRTSNKDELKKWHDYHMEFETKTYREKFGGRVEE